MDEESESSKVKLLTYGHIMRRQGQDSKPGSLTLEPMILPLYCVNKEAMAVEGGYQCGLERLTE